MILGLSVPAFTTLHVVISLIGIASGLLVLVDFLRNRYLNWLTAIFLAFTIATSVTGFFFHSKAIGPPHIVGGLSLLILAVALWALYGAKLAGRARGVYVATAVLALYLNVFVLVAQLFNKLPALKALAPTGTEPPFGAAQGVVLIAFALLGWQALKRFRSAG